MSILQISCYFRFITNAAIKITTQGKAATFPTGDNNTSAGSAKNRRVAIILNL
ncbi:MAG: hypothetical protein AB8G86_15075 [Saprospiraceae bacterium]